MSGSSNKKIIPIIVVAVISIAAIALIFNSPSQDQANETDQTNTSEKMEEQIQEIKDVSQPESALTSKLESNQNPSQLRAAIIDQIHDQIPNYELQSLCGAPRPLVGRVLPSAVLRRPVRMVSFSDSFP